MTLSSMYGNHTQDINNAPSQAKILHLHLIKEGYWTINASNYQCIHVSALESIISISAKIVNNAAFTIPAMVFRNLNTSY
jgi:hypothetical protein